MAKWAPGCPATLVGAAALLLGSSPAAGQAPPWQLKLGFSYLATTGNTRTSSTGLSAAYEGSRKTWNLQAQATALRASGGGRESAERYTAAVRGGVEVWKALALATGLTWERDLFAGITSRAVVDTGLRWHPAASARTKLEVVGAAAYTQEERVGAGEEGFLGALLRVEAARDLSATSRATLAAAVYPNFEAAAAWRAHGAAGVQASLSSQLALRVAWEYRYHNRPPAGFRKADTATVLSLVAQFPNLP